MSDLISRKAAVNALEELRELDYERYVRLGHSCFTEDDWECLIKSYKEIVETLPIAEPKTGHWIRGDIHQISNVPSIHWICSECGSLVETAHYAYRCYYNYCPNCGADMRGETNDLQTKEMAF